MAGAGLNPKSAKQKSLGEVVSDIVELLNARFPDGKVEFVHKDEDPRDYRVSFEKFARSVEFEAEHTIAEGIDEVHSLLQSGLLDDPYAPAYRN